jgi:hypothetical protein
MEMQKPFPQGDFICIECDEQLSQKASTGNKIIAD